MARISGCFDGVDGSRASGWVANLDSPDQIVAVEFFSIASDGSSTRLGVARANRPREDLRAIGLQQIHHGFEWRIPFLPRQFLLRAHVAEHGIELPGSPVRVTPQPVYEGSLDGVVQGVLRGWAWAWDPGVDIAVEVHVDGQLQATLPARTERPDLVAARVGNGRHGFAWIVPDQFADGSAHEFACRIAGTSVWLAGGPHRTIIARRPRSSSAAAAVRGYAKRPAAEQAGRRWLADLPRASSRQRRARQITAAEATGEAFAAARGEFWRPLSGAAGPGVGPAVSVAGAGKRVRLLIPIWGCEYIERFCRTGLASLLSPNNLPYLAQLHRCDVVFLIRGGERELFAAYPAYRRLLRTVPVSFAEIDATLARYFDPDPHAYATALTHAFLHGIQSAGDAACDTDFLFWNADFVAADGVFRSLAHSIAEGVRCTLAPSLRVDPEVEQAVLTARRTDDGAVLDIGPREWVALASHFPHPTVRAQTVNRFEERMIDSVNQLYWRINDELTVGRVFLMFMLHIRPEVVWPEVYGHCDYVFVPEMVPSGNVHFETQSDRMLIVEIQHDNREAADIVFGDHPMTPKEVAAGVGRWTTREHRLASRQLVVFNSGAVGTDLEPARRLTDRFMSQVYRRLPAEPIWHNGHFYWTDSLAALARAYAEPGPDHPRSHLAAALRWTKYDIDVLRESWPDPAGPPHDIFGLAVPLDPELDVSAWLAAAHARYFKAWLDSDQTQFQDATEIDIVSGRFHGFGWGLVERREQGWVRRLGPDARAVLLLRVPQKRRVKAGVHIADGPQGPGVVKAYVNGIPEGVYVTPSVGSSALLLDIDPRRVARAQGRLQILLSAPAAEAASQCGGGVALAGVTIRIED